MNNVAAINLLPVYTVDYTMMARYIVRYTRSRCARNRCSATLKIALLYFPLTCNSL